VVYLSGAIDRAPDFGRPWRARVAEVLRHVGAQPYDPTEQQARVCGLTVEALRELQEVDIDLFKEKTRLVIAADLHVIAREASAVVAQVGDHAHMGTYAEMGVAIYHDIPLFVILEHPQYRASGWTISSAEAVFQSVDDFISWLNAEQRMGKTVDEILGCRSIA